MSTPPPPPGVAGPGPGDGLPTALRWLVVVVAGAMAVAVSTGLYFFAIVSVLGCFSVCDDPDPQPLLAGLLVLGAAGVVGGAAGLVPWALRRRHLVLRTALVMAALVVAVFVLSIIGS